MSKFNAQVKIVLKAQHVATRGIGTPPIINIEPCETCLDDKFDQGHTEGSYSQG